MNKILLIAVLTVFLSTQAFAFEMEGPQNFTIPVDSEVETSLNVSSNQNETIHFDFNSGWFTMANKTHLNNETKTLDVTIHPNTTQIYSYEKNITADNNQTTKQFPYNIKVTYPQTNITLQYADDDIQVFFGQSYNGIVKIKNTGDKNTLDNITVDSERWIIFQNNSFNLDAGEERIVDYNISMTKDLINTTNMTNQTHTVNISIESEAANNIYHNISVFVPYYPVEKSILQDEITTQKLRQMCKEPEYEDSVWCTGVEPKIVYKNRTKYIKEPFSMNMTKDEIESLIDQREFANSCYKALNISQNKLKNNTEEQISREEQTQNLISELQSDVSEIKELERKEAQSSGFGTWLIILIILFGAAGFVGWYIIKRI